MAWCCIPKEASELLILREASRRSRDDNTNERELNATSRPVYEELFNGDDDVQSNATAQKNIFWGYLFALFGVITVAAALACTQILNHSVPHSELNGLIFTGQLIIVSPFVIGLKRCDVRVEKTRIGWMVLGLALATAGTYGHYGVAYYLPLGVGNGISRSLVLVINYVISCCINKVVLWYELVAAILCMSGMVMVTQPEVIFHYSGAQVIGINKDNNFSYQSPCHVSMPVNLSMNITHMSNVGDKNSSLRLKEEVIGYMICIAAALTSAAYMHLVNHKLSDFNIFVYSFWASLFGLVCSFCIMAATETPFFPTATLCVIMLIITIFAAGTHGLCDYRAYQLLDPVLAALIETLQIALTFTLQYTLLSGIYPGHANALEISGAVILFIGNALVPAYQLIQVLLLKKKTGYRTE